MQFTFVLIVFPYSQWQIIQQVEVSVIDKSGFFQLGIAFDRFVYRAVCSVKFIGYYLISMFKFINNIFFIHFIRLPFNRIVRWLWYSTIIVPYPQTKVNSIYNFYTSFTKKYDLYGWINYFDKLYVLIVKTSPALTERL